MICRPVITTLSKKVKSSNLIQKTTQLVPMGCEKGNNNSAKGLLPRTSSLSPRTAEESKKRYSMMPGVMQKSRMVDNLGQNKSHHPRSRLQAWKVRENLHGFYPIRRYSVCFVVLSIARIEHREELGPKKEGKTNKGQRVEELPERGNEVIW